MTNMFDRLTGRDRAAHADHARRVVAVLTEHFAELR